MASIYFVGFSSTKYLYWKPVSYTHLTIVLPNIEEDFKRGRAVDEMPQSAAGRTIMTTEPKFIPEQAVHVKIDDCAAFSVRLIDCVGYIVPSALGYIENDQPRMVMTPWYEEPIPFNMAAEIGTKKVITEHSTICLLYTSPGFLTGFASCFGFGRLYRLGLRISCVLSSHSDCRVDSKLSYI